VYLGWKRWQLIEVSPNNARTARDPHRRANAKRCSTLWETNPKLRANPGAFRRLIGRYDFATARLRRRPHGRRAVHRAGRADVGDRRRLPADGLPLSHADRRRGADLLDAPKEQQRAAARAQASDMARANAAWQYMFTRSHYYGADGRTKQRHRSGFVRHPRHDQAARSDLRLN
jgi:hypothetical protein